MCSSDLSSGEAAAAAGSAAGLLGAAGAVPATSAAVGPEVRSTIAVAPRKLPAVLIGGLSLVAAVPFFAFDMLYDLYVFNRRGVCLFDKQWNGKKRDDEEGAREEDHDH